MLRQLVVPFVIIAPFFALQWRFEPRRDDSPESVRRLLHSDSRFAEETLNGVLSTVDPNMIIEGKPLIFHFGIDRCNPEQLERLLSRGADPNAQGPDTGYAIMAAMKRAPLSCNTEPVLFSLIKHKAKVNVREENDTPLGILLRSPWVSDTLLEQLLKAGANPNEPADSHTHGLAPPLAIALEHAHRNAVLPLIKAGARLNGQLYLVNAIAEGDLKFAQMLLDQGAELTGGQAAGLFHEFLGPQAQDNLNFYGAKATPKEAILFLLKLKPPLNVHFGDDDTLLTYSRRSPEMFRLFMEEGADPNFKSINDLSPLAKLVLDSKGSNCSSEQMSLLLQKGANANEHLPYHAVYQGRPDWVLTSNYHDAQDPSRKISLLEALLALHSPISGPECASLLAHAQTKIDRYAAQLLEQFDRDLYFKVSYKSHDY
jgi:hypothetical protein